MDEKELNQLSQMIGLEWARVGLPELGLVDKRAALLLLLIHKGFNNSVWGSKRLRYWDAFENNLLRATAAANLPEFVEQFAGAMGAALGRNQTQRTIAMKLVYGAGGESVLDCILVQRKVMAALVQAMRDAIPSAYDYEERVDETLVLSGEEGTPLFE